MSKKILYNIYDTPPLSRNKYGSVSTNSIINSSNNLFSTPDYLQSVDITSVSQSAAIPDFIGATDEMDGARGLVPAPVVGQNHSHFLSGDGTWKYDAANAWLKEFPYDSLTPTGLGIEGDFHVGNTLSCFNLSVEGRAHFFELVVDKVRSSGGNIVVSPSSFKCDKVGRLIEYSTNTEPFTSLYLYRPDIQRCLEGNNISTLIAQRMYMRDDDGSKAISGTANVGDMVRCKTFNVKSGVYQDVSNKDYWTFVVGVGNENYKIYLDDSVEEVTATYIDIAYAFVHPNGDLIPIGSVFSEEDVTINTPLYLDYYDITSTKNKSSLTLSGTTDSVTEEVLYDEMIEVAWFVLKVRGCVLPTDIEEANLVGVPVDNVIDTTTPVSGATPYTDPDYNISKYDEEPYSDGWTFGYGQMNVKEDDELVCFGSLHDTDRRNLIMLSASTPMDSELKSPAISQYTGIDIFGVSISGFRITTISYGKNIFKGDFEVLAENGQYTNILTVTAYQTQNMVSDAYNGAISYTTQRADEISTYVYDSYAYSLSYTSQQADQIKSTVADLETDTESSITQLSDRIDLSVTKNDMEMVGIHLDGANSTVNLVGSLSITQNGDGDIDTVKVYDEDSMLRVEVTPEEIPDKDDLAIDDRYFNFDVVQSTPYQLSTVGVGDLLPWGTSYRNTYWLSTQGTYYSSSCTFEGNIGSFYANDTISVENIKFNGNININFKQMDGANIDNLSYTITNISYSIIKPDDTVLVSGDCGILNYSSDTVYGDVNRVVVNGLSVSNITNIPINEAGNYKIRFGVSSDLNIRYRFRDNNRPSTPYTFTVIYSGFGVWNGSVKSHSSGGIVNKSFMEIGSDGFYYTGGTNKYVYTASDEFEVRFGDSKMNCSEASGVAIYNKVGVYNVSGSNHIVDLRNKVESVFRINRTGGTYSDDPTVRLPKISEYGYGRMVTLIGFIGLIITTNGTDVIYIKEDPFNRAGSIFSTDSFSSVRLDTQNQTANTYLKIKSNGICQLISLEDGWHIINSNIY